MYYTTSGAALLREAGPYLTAPSREFMSLLALEDRQPVGADAGLLVSWQELVRRLAIADKYWSRTTPLSHLRRTCATCLWPTCMRCLANGTTRAAFPLEIRLCCSSVGRRLERYVVRAPVSSSRRTYRAGLSRSSTREQLEEDSRRRGVRRKDNQGRGSLDDSCRVVGSTLTAQAKRYPEARRPTVISS